MEKSSRIYVAGHRGMVGSAIVRKLRSLGHENLILKTRQEVDLLDQAQVRAFFEKERPEYVFDAAARVGGIMANKTAKADFISQNLRIQMNVIEASHEFAVKKLLFLGSSCIYPRDCPQPIQEDYLLTGHLETTNDAYAIAKICGIMQCKAYREQYQSDFISLMPTNLYGPNDNFDLESSHVLPALIHKFHNAKVNGNEPVTLWGTGSPFREFLHVDDLAQACIHFMENYSSEQWVNIGTGEDISIKDLATLIQKTVGHEGEIRWDTDKPDGTPRKLLNVDRARENGWKSSIALEDGISNTYQWFLENYKGRN